MLSHDAFRGVHLGGEVLVVGGKLNPFGSFEEVEAVAFFDMEPVQDFFGQYDANGVANCCDLDSRRHTSLPGFIITYVITPVGKPEASEVWAFEGTRPGGS